MITPDKYDSLYVMISPTVRCNLSCRYCYVDQNKPLRETDMDEEDIRYVYEWVKSYSRLVGIEMIRIEWFGGEPLLKGGSFLDNAINMEELFFPAGEYRLDNTIQTNILMACREDVVSLYKKHFHSYVSGSFDYRGRFRVNKNGTDVTPQILQNIKTLQQKGLRVGVVCTMTRSNLGCIEEMYDFFCQNRIDFRVNRAAHIANPEIASEEITTAEYSAAVNRLFELYTKDPKPAVRFANFDSMARLYLMGLSDICVTVTKPHLHLAFEAEGRLFSRCRFASPVGNYRKNTPEEILDYFRHKTTARVAPQECANCRFFDKTCMGGCFGERDLDCFHSDCGYRGETNQKLWEYVENYMNSHGYKYGAYRKE